MRPYGSAYWCLLREMTLSEFKTREQGTLLGFLWTLLHPALMFTVLYLLFTKWVGRFVDNYAAYLIVGLVQWQFFDKATSFSLSSLRRRTNLARNFRFSKELIVLSALGSILLSYLIELGVLVLFVACLGVRPGFSWLYTPAVLLLHLVFTAGVSLALALLAVQVQDLDRVWVILTTVGFYLTPIFYPLSMLTETRQRLLLFNPLLHIIDSFRACLLGGPPPSLAGVCGVLLLGCTLIGLSLSLFRRNPAWIMDRILQP